MFDTLYIYIYIFSLSEEELEIGSYQTSAVTKINTIDDDILIGEAGKMGVVFSLVDHLCEQGHRILLFSQSRKVLDIVQKVFNNQVCLAVCMISLVLIDVTLLGLSFSRSYILLLRSCFCTMLGRNANSLGMIVYFSIFLTQFNIGKL